jgi:hypothetical protein
VVNVLGDAFGAAIVHHLAVRDAAAAHAPANLAAAGADETRRESENE